MVQEDLICWGVFFLCVCVSLLDALASSEDDDDDESSSEETKQSSSQKLFSNSQELLRECTRHLCRLINIYTVTRMNSKADLVSLGHAFTPFAKLFAWSIFHSGK